MASTRGTGFVISAVAWSMSDKRPSTVKVDAQRMGKLVTKQVSNVIETTNWRCRETWPRATLNPSSPQTVRTKSDHIRAERSHCCVDYPSKLSRSLAFLSTRIRAAQHSQSEVDFGNLGLIRR